MGAGREGDPPTIKKGVIFDGPSGEGRGGGGGGGRGGMNLELDMPSIPATPVGSKDLDQELDSEVRQKSLDTAKRAL